MTNTHSDLGPELRALAQSILDRIDPAVRVAAAAAAGADGPGKCQQVWCPVCALAALVSGEQHPLLGVIAEHGVALLSVVRAMTDAMADPTGPGSGGPDTPSPPTGPRPDGDPPPSAPGHYQHIPVTVED
jgi:hypothetical protein